MKGSIRERPPGSGHWECRVYAGLDPAREPGDPPRQRVVTRSIRGRKRDAERELRRLATEVEEGRHRATDGTLAYLLEKWYAQEQARWSPKHRETMRWIIDRRILPALGPVPLSRLEPMQLDDLYNRMQTAGAATATIRKVHNTIHRALRQAVRWGWVTANVADRASPPPVVSAEIDPPTDAQVERLVTLAAAENPELATFLLVAIATGARRGEVCALRRDDVELGGACAPDVLPASLAPSGHPGTDLRVTPRPQSQERRRDSNPYLRESHEPDHSPTIRIAHAITAVAGQPMVKQPKSKAGRRTIHIDEATAAAIAAHLARMVERAAGAGVTLDPNPYLFSAAPACDRPWYPDSVTKAFSRLRVKAGLPHVRAHDLRHAHASTLLVEMGVDILTVAKRLGHSRPSITSDIYGHSVPAADAEVARRWGERKKPAPG